MHSKRSTALTESRSFSRMTPFRAVFLDVGGTLLHLDRDYILSCLAERGIKRDRTAFLAADREARAAMRVVLNSAQPGTDASRWKVYATSMLGALGCFDEDAIAVRARIADRNREGRLWAFTEAGTKETLQSLKQNGYTIGIVSNADGRVNQYLDYAGLTPWIDFIVDSGSVGVEKPDPRIFQIACDRANIEPGEAVHVGDLYEVDVTGARRAGVTPLLLDAEGISTHHDVDTIRTLPELTDWLLRRAAA